MRNFVKKIIRLLGLLEPLKKCRLVWKDFFLTPICVCRYKKNIRRLKRKSKSEKIKVLFLLGERAKWKCQALYDLMEASDAFDPLVGLTCWNQQSAQCCPYEKLMADHAETERYLDKVGVRYVRTYDGNPQKGFSLERFHPDIVFYSEPYEPCACQHPSQVSKYALTCYIPYFTPNYGECDMDSKQSVHRLVHSYFTLNEAWSRFYLSRREWWSVLPYFKGTGLPSLDLLSRKLECVQNEGYIIYAPHFSFPCKKHQYLLLFYSTFDWNGIKILEYAKSHKELNWAFKPHPLLKQELVATGLMTKKEAEEYYREWEKIATCNYDADYQRLFLESSAMITDSASFLIEYAVTQKPLIHLICDCNNVVAMPDSQKIFNTYYKVRNLDEMYETFRTVLEENKDPRCEMRKAALDKSRLSDGQASKRIIEYLTGILERK